MDAVGFGVLTELEEDGLHPGVICLFFLPPVCIDTAGGRDRHPQSRQMVPFHQFPDVSIVLPPDVEVAAAIGPPPEPTEQAQVVHHGMEPLLLLRPHLLRWIAVNEYAEPVPQLADELIQIDAVGE